MINIKQIFPQGKLDADLQQVDLRTNNSWRLKIGEIKHPDLGQMQMYVNYYDREIRIDQENKTIGIVLCRDKNQSVVEYTLPENNAQIFASKYETILPSKEELKSLITEQDTQH